MKEVGVLESFVADISKAVAAFSEEDADSKRMLDELSKSDPPKFFSAGIHVVAKVEASAGSRHLVLLLAKNKRLSSWLLNPKVCTLSIATAVARALADAGVPLQATLELALDKALQGQASASNADRILRILDVLEATGSPSWDSFEVELMAYPDKVVRSKASLLIGRGNKDVEWIARRLLDRHPRVQANAVEALWSLEAAESRPLLQEALKSKYNRVFANAALGLYRLGDPSIIAVLLEATEHTDPLFRVSALWAIGQTQDPRFLPALSEQFKTAEGKPRLALAGAIARIRQREKSVPEAEAIQIHISRAAVEPDGKRQLAFALSSQPPKNFSGLKATEFLIWENEALVQDYQARPGTRLSPIVAGFVAPWFESSVEPLEKTFQEGLNQCLAVKGPDDSWRIDRYTVEPPPAAPAADSPPAPDNPSDDTVLPYDDSIVTPHMKTVQIFSPEPDQLRKIMASAVPLDRAAGGGIAAIQRQCKAIGQRPGARHVFVLLHGLPDLDTQGEAGAASLRSLATESGVVFHGIAPGSAGRWPLFRDFCLSNAEGSFVETSEAGMLEELVSAYANLANKFEISYSLPASAEPGAGKLSVKLKVSSDQGSGQAEFSLEPPPAQPAPAPDPASAQESSAASALAPERVDAVAAPAA